MALHGRQPFAQFAAILAGAAALALASPAAVAGSTWDGIRAEVWGSRPVLPGAGIVTLKAPTRPDDQRAVPVTIEAQLADGRSIKAVSFIVDENPSPVAAVFRFPQQRERVALSAKFRFNAETDVRAVVEASDGQVYMVSQHVKFAGGQAACSAPPAGDPKEIAETMGRMQLADIPEKTAATAINRKVKLDISHPNHTGMVLDQQTLLYVPLLMVSRLDVQEGDEQVMTMDGSITLAQNPQIEFDYKINGADKLTVRLHDSGGGSWEKVFPIGQGS